MESTISGEEPAVLLPRSVYLSLLSLASDTLNDSGTKSELKNAVERAETERLKFETSDEEARALLLITRNNWRGIVGNEEGYYLAAAEDPNDRLRMNRPCRLLWDGKTRGPTSEDIYVFLDPPFPAFLIESLEKKALIRPMKLRAIEGTQYKAYLWRRISDTFAAVHQDAGTFKTWSSAREGKSDHEGAWLLNGSGQKIAWFPQQEHAQYIADCAVALHVLEQDVLRHCGGPTLEFPKNVRNSGLPELVGDLVGSIHPENGFEQRPPQELVHLGDDLLRIFNRFYTASSEYRSKRMRFK